MDWDKRIGKDIVEEIFNRTMKLYTSLLTDSSDPLRRNELLRGPIDQLSGADTSAIIALIEHSTIMTMHALLNHVTNFEGEDPTYSLEVVVKSNGSAASMLEFIDDPGVRLVEDDGWIDTYSDDHTVRH